MKHGKGRGCSQTSENERKMLVGSAQESMAISGTYQLKGLCKGYVRDILQKSSLTGYSTFILGSWTSDWIYVGLVQLQLNSDDFTHCHTYITICIYCKISNANCVYMYKPCTYISLIYIYIYICRYICIYIYMYTHQTLG